MNQKWRKSEHQKGPFQSPSKSKLPVVVRLISLLFIIFSADVASGQELLNKDSDMQAIFFFDNFSIVQSIDMHKRFFQPERVDDFVWIDENPLFGNMEYLNVIYDEDAQLYRMWYLVHKRGGGSICYAESQDGLKWELPDLPDDTDRNTAEYKNAVFSGDVRVSQGAVTYDPYDMDPSRRYKLAYAEDVESMHLAYSPDGINWRIDPGPSWTPIPSETENHVNFNPFTGKYQIICRAATVDRRIALTESEDLVNWTEPRIILHPSPLDPVGLQLYGMPTFMYEDIFLGLLWKFQTGTSPKGGLRRNDGIIEPELTYSYDGLTWNRTHRTLIERSARGPYYGGRLYSESIVIDHEGNIRIYSRGAYSEHGTQGTFGKSVLVLHKLRRDGFAGLESVGREGYLKTKPFVLKGDDLSLNVQAWNGSIRVQISDERSVPYPGFSFDDCIEWTGDDVFYHPQWKGKEDLSELKGKIVRFEIKLKEGILYAIRAQLNPAHCNPPRLRY